jgi:signal transduction histidine kinase
MSRGEISVRLETFDLVPDLNDLVAEFRGHEGGHRIAASLPDALPVRADRARVKQIVGNLLENALKYAPDGDIVLRAFWKPSRRRGERASASGAGFARVEVLDRGPGIPAAERRRVWDRFYRGQQVVALNLARGTGIGLAVVKALVEAQGGRVGLSSTAGGGTCFWFELPASQGAETGQ